MEKAIYTFQGFREFLVKFASAIGTRYTSASSPSTPSLVFFLKNWTRWNAPAFHGPNVVNFEGFRTEIEQNKAQLNLLIKQYKLSR